MVWFRWVSLFAGVEPCQLPFTLIFRYVYGPPRPQCHVSPRNSRPYDQGLGKPLVSLKAKNVGKKCQPHLWKSRGFLPATCRRYSSLSTFQQDRSWCPRNFLHRHRLGFNISNECLSRSPGGSLKNPNNLGKWHRYFQTKGYYVWWWWWWW